MALSPENKAALSRDMEDSLVRAGIPNTYANARLASYGATGKGLADWLNNTGMNQMRYGRTLLIEGPTLPSLDLFYVTGRALHVSNVAVRVIQPLSLAFALEGRDADEIERLYRVPALMLNPFQGSDESPFTSGQRYRVQEFLLDRLAAHKAHVLLSRSCPKPWWSQDFLEIILDDAHIVSVKK